MTRLIDKTVRDLLAAFRSPDPTPGGGSASALAGAVGAGLLAMVASLSKPRASTAEEVARLAAAGRSCAELSDELAALVDRDSSAYDAVMGAYRLPKSTEAETQTRSERIQAALAAAVDAPLDVMRHSAAAIEQASVVAGLGNRNASSDVEVALHLLRAALRGAKANVDINLAGIKDAAFRERVASESTRLHAVSEESRRP